jgi:diguanylate cyclase
MADAWASTLLQSSLQISTKKILELMTDMVFVMTVDSSMDLRYAMLNASAMKSSGLNEYAYGATFHEVVEPTEAEFLHSRYTKAAVMKRPVSFVLNHEGQIGESLLTPMIDASGNCTQIVGITRDITKQFEQEKNLEYLAFRDQLTGLFNRHALYARLKNAIQKAEQASSYLSILILDCDNLKMVNDTFGHAAGDLMLREVAKRIQGAVPEAHTVARTGGDEFLTAVHIANELDIFEITERILSQMRKPWQNEKTRLTLSVSIGIASYPIDSMDIQEVIRIADEGLYAAKEMGGNRYMLVRTEAL